MCSNLIDPDDDKSSSIPYLHIGLLYYFDIGCINNDFHFGVCHVSLVSHNNNNETFDAKICPTYT
ncbi:hypothetical protein BLA29_003301 [Euroglyphus maynei]|uniref:Uncharacterized protein n=1 Tax=Euroglyphus maynei TaxID=6958 RepID=A0A1Y3AWU2_EURMA|nr:hypothetical protein BLA29_003301 [Euroglyphus maynei]